MKNAVQQSTKLALDKILTNFLKDLIQALNALSSESTSGAVSCTQPLILIGGVRWRGAGALDSCEETWERDLRIAAAILTGTVSRDSIEYETRDKSDHSGEINRLSLLLLSQPD